MTSKAEEIVSCSLRSLLGTSTIGEAIEESQELRDFLGGLEFFLSEAMRAKYSEWKFESLDGILLYNASKKGTNEVEIVGMGIFITDQTLTPLHVHLKVADSADEIEWLSCKLGESGPTGMVRHPYGSTNWIKYLNKLDVTSVDWVYEIATGKEKV